MNRSPEDRIAGAIVLFEEGTALWARITTNASFRRLRQRLVALDLVPLIEGVLEYRRDRACGGDGFEILFCAGVSRDQVRAKLEQL